ncbi:hypothetical protein LN42_09505 [Marinitoga sp. 1137]|uniref:methyl-accepting chemotaxis protein n=1 Tax=Marinitoga sp. 1137 TaxID=1545835 RepID=UPI000950492C|nr:methyl-accepting chemotaxis protein [Marinitoga sp. 1137]APT76586.1 hypothetical protein LN42_09505 [Marinitoga sp. 1137]
MKLTGKVLTMVLGITILSLISLTFFTVKSSVNSMTNSSAEKLIAVSEKSSNELNMYFGQVDDFLRLNSKRNLFIKNVVMFEEIFHELEKEHGEVSEILQKAFIDDNPYPVGEKYKLTELSGVHAQELKEYNEIHKVLHPIVKNMIDTYGFYDLFLISADGDIPYTYYKERDFATNILEGKWKDTNLGSLVRLLKEKDDNNVHYVDFASYAPSNGIPAGFAGISIKDSKGNTIGYLVVQLPINKINKVLHESAGMGESGETYVVGPDKLMRSDSRFKEGTILKQMVDTVSVQKALNGEEGWNIIKDYRGIKVISAYMPFKHAELNWALIGEIDYDESTADAKALIRISIITLVIIIVISIVVSYVFTKNLLKPLKMAVGAFAEIAKGDLTVKIDVKGNDEIAELGRSLNSMVKNLNDTMKELINISTKLNSSSTDLAAVSEENSANVQEISSQAEVIGENTENLSSAVEEVSSGIEEIATSSQNISESTQEMSQSAEETTEFAHIGQKSMNDVVKSMEGVSEETSNVAKIVSDLAGKAQNIGEIVETIGSITEQTNLLALNAAIEAARAGEAGKGFAVVADEIRKLAEESRNATDKIADILKEIQESANTANEATQKAKKEVEKTNEIIEVANKQFHEIAEKIDVVKQLSENITAASEEQSASTEEMASAVTNVSKSIAEITEKIKHIVQAIEEERDGAEEVAKESQVLSELAEQLHSITKKFRI